MRRLLSGYSYRVTNAHSMNALSCRFLSGNQPHFQKTVTMHPHPLSLSLSLTHTLLLLPILSCACSLSLLPRALARACSLFFSLALWMFCSLARSLPPQTDTLTMAHTHIITECPPAWHVCARHTHMHTQNQPNMCIHCVWICTYFSLPCVHVRSDALVGEKKDVLFFLTLIPVFPNSRNEYTPAPSHTQGK